MIELTEQNFKTGNYDLVLIGFRMSIVDGFLLQVTRDIKKDR
jgi:hydrogenase maturation factor